MKILQTLNLIASAVNVVNAQQAEEHELKMPNYKEFEKRFGKLDISEKKYLSQMKKIQELLNIKSVSKISQLSKISLQYIREQDLLLATPKPTNVEKLLDIDSKLSKIATEFGIKIGISAAVASLMFWNPPTAIAIGLFSATLATQSIILSNSRADISNLISRLQLNSISSENIEKAKKLRDKLVRELNVVHKILVGFSYLSWILPIDDGLLYFPQIIQTLKGLSIS